MEHETHKQDGQDKDETAIGSEHEGQAPKPADEHDQSAHLHYPRFIERFGVWPVNIGLFFFYNNLVSLAVMLAGIIIMTSTGVTDEQVISQKLGGLSVISTLMTLGLTLIYSRRFYFTRD